MAQFLFDWDAILQVQQEFLTAFNNGMSGLKTWIAGQQSSNFSGVHSFFTNIENNIASLLSSNNDGPMQAQQKNGNNPQTLYGAGGAKSYTKSRWLMQKFQDNASQASSPSLPAGSSDTFINALTQFYTIVKNTITNSSNLAAIPSDIAQVFSNFSLLTSDPSSFIQHSFSDVLRLFVDVSTVIVQLVDAVVEKFLAVVADLLDAVLHLLTASIDIPGLTRLWGVITNGSPLSILSLCSLIVAIPTSIVSEAINSTQAPGSTPGIIIIGILFAEAFYVIVDALSDATELGRAMTIFYIALNILLLGTGFPIGLDTSIVGGYIFWAAQAIPIIATASTVIVSPLTPLLISIMPQVLCLYGIFMIMSTIILAYYYPDQFSGDDQLIKFHNIFNFLPDVAKPLGAVKAPFDATKIALGIIDGVCDLTSVILGTLASAI
jgi:hypothetical protein